MGRPRKPPEIKDMLKKYLPVDEIFDKDEREMYEGLISVYLNDFDEKQLSAHDMDDLMGIAMNKVLEMRLLKTSKEDPTRHLEISAAVERLRKQTEKLKENLAARRRDRIDPKKHSGLSIVDLAVRFDIDKKAEMYDKAKKLKEEEEKLKREKSKFFKGNKGDIDS